MFTRPPEGKTGKPDGVDGPAGEGVEMAASIRRKSPFPPCSQEVRASMLHVESPQTKSAAAAFA